MRKREVPTAKKNPTIANHKPLEKGQRNWKNVGWMGGLRCSMLTELDNRVYENEIFASLFDLTTSAPSAIEASWYKTMAQIMT